jgi:hypothetical protein
MSDESFNLYNKRVSPTKNNSQQQGISYLEREREGVRQKEEKKDLQNCGRAWECACMQLRGGGRIGRKKEK